MGTLKKTKNYGAQMNMSEEPMRRFINKVQWDNTAQKSVWYSVICVKYNSDMM